MDIQRIGLGIALAVVTYLLILEWNNDYGRPQTAPVNQVANELPSGAPDIETGISGGVPAVQPDLDNDIDVPVAAVASDAPVAVNQSSTKKQSGLISVRTDAFEIAIDPVGGDIVQAALRKFPLYVDTPNQPFVLLEQNGQRTYVTQSGLVGRDGPDANPEGRPMYQSQKSTYRMADGAEQLVVDLVFESSPDIRITKRYTFKRDDHVVNLEFLIDNRSSEAWQGALFGQIKRDDSADPSSVNAAMSMSTYVGPALFTTKKPYKKISFGDIDDEAFQEQIPAGWIAMLQHYFLSAWVPEQSQTHTYFTRKNRSGVYIAGFSATQTVVPPGSQASVGAQLYLGPKSQDRLAELSPGLDLTVDYGWLWFIAQPIFWLLSFCHSFLGNWGFAIAMVTLLIKLAFFQLSAASYRSMANMRRVQPEMARMKELYGDDRQKMSQAMMDLYKKEKINPLGGCLPILVQIPVFISLYWVLLESVELRHAPFMLWIVDLSVKDPYFVLPIIMGVTMFLQQLLNPAPPDPVQARIMKMLPIIFTFFFLWFPAGLVLYWVVNNVLSILQQWVITRNIEKNAKPVSA